MFFEIISPWKHIPATLLEKKPFFYVSMHKPAIVDELFRSFAESPKVFGVCHVKFPRDSFYKYPR